MTATTHRALHVIAREIIADWKKVYFGAVPYIDAIRSLDRVTDNYGSDSGKYIINYFLANASGWRGEKAKTIKAELKNMIK
jgi:hypothetical protein